MSIETITFSDGSTFTFEPKDKVLLVGPNNSGKSLTLREIIGSVNSNDGRFQFNLVVQGLSLAKLGTSAELTEFLEANAEYEPKSDVFRYNNWFLQRGNVGRWDKQYLNGVSEPFIMNIVAETRLQITALQTGIRPGEQKTVPQHVLYDDPGLMARISGLFQRAFGKELFFDFRGGTSLPIHVGVPPAPVPGEDRVDVSYVLKVRNNPPLHEQGDGIKSYAGILFEVVATERDVTLIDEPEAFLHPPQMRRLGETLAKEVQGQLFVATHSSDIMRGFLTGADGQIRIIRMQLDGSQNQVTETSVDVVKTLWEQPDLRYSNALEGIFHEQTIICEDDSDCRLLNSTADFLERGNHGLWKDTAYVPAGGKHGIPRIAAVLRQIGVPVKAVFDIDFLSEEALVRTTVEAFGGAWETIEPLWSRIDAAVRDGNVPKTGGQIKSAIIDLLGASEGDDLPKGDITELMKQGKPWASVKKHGRAGIPNGQAQVVYHHLEAALKALGVFLVPVGEIENYCPWIGLHGPKFVTQLLRTVPLGDDRLSALRDFVHSVHE